LKTLSLELKKDVREEEETLLTFKVDDSLVILKKLVIHL
jgi:hypothetical protein